MTLQQDGTQFKGQVSIQNKHRPDEVDSYYDQTSGDIVGTVVGNRFEATVYWADSKVGVYSGQIGPQGLVVGRTFNKNNPAENADFHGSPAFDCLTASAPNGAGNANNGNSGKPAVALGRTMVQPSIVEPQQGGAYPPQTPLRVRVVPAKDAKDTAYRIEIQLQKDGFIWTEFATLDTPAAVAQSPQGYRGWGGKQDASKRWMTATVGTYRLRARGSAPQLGQPGEWVQFRIDGQPGTQVDPMSQVKALPGKAGAAAQSAASRLGSQPSTANALGSAPAVAVKNQLGAASLNAQLLTPKSLSAPPTATPLDPVRNKVGPVLLNPQPLPPAGLQQMPSSLR